jgi:hypothetical protein
MIFWEQIGLGGTTGQFKNFNAAAYIFTMKNKFKWKDKHEIELGEETRKTLNLKYSLSKPKQVIDITPDANEISNE